MRAACLLLAAQLAFAQAGVEGNWAGTLDAGAVKLRLALKLARAADGSLTGTLDSLDQGAKDLPITTARQNGAAVSFELRQIGGSFQGTLAGQQLSGTWKQGGGAMPLAFHRVTSVPVLRRPQEPKKPYPYHEEEISYENKAGAAKLAGALTAPADGRAAAAVLLITGSGQQDRDESLMGHKPFLVLSDHLTRKGLAVLRVDDRGVGGSTGELHSATSEDFAGDVRAGVEYLKSRGFTRIGLVGHSEGGMIASMVAAGSKDLAFIVLLAGTGVTGDQVVYEQAAAIARAAGASAAAVAQNRALQEQMITIIRREADPAARAARLVELKSQLNVVNPNITAQFEMAATPWFRFFMLHDPAADLKRVSCPVLAMGGELDLQVSAAQNLPAIEQALKAGGNRDVTILKLPRLNHLFQTAKTGSPAEYGQIEETMAPAALDAISGWILKTVTSPGKL